MRVLYLVGALEAGGLERFVTRAALRAKAGGELEPSVCCLSARRGAFLPVLETAGVAVYEAPPGWTRRGGALTRFAALLRGIKPDVVHSQSNWALVQQWLAVRMAGRAAFCVTERSCYDLRGAARLRRRAQFHLLRRLGARYSANGRAVAEHLARQAGVSADTIPVLPNGAPAFTPDPALRAEMRARLGWQESDMGIGYVGRLMPGKGQAAFLHALRALRDRGLPARACLVGGGPDRERLAEQARALALCDCVTLTGTVPNVEDYLQAFDLCALFTAREGMPNVILEAMAAGRAIAATPVGAIPELLADGEAGLLVPAPTPETMADALARLIQDATLRERLGQAAAERARIVYSMEACYEKLLRHYREAR